MGSALDRRGRRQAGRRRLARAVGLVGRERSAEQQPGRGRLMTSFAARCGVDDAARAAHCEEVLKTVRENGVEQVRIGWGDLHGVLRGKTLMPSAVQSALRSGVGMVSTILLKDTSDRTAYRVFEPGGTDALPGFGFANNLVLVPDPASFRVLPWASATGWMQAQAWFEDGTPLLLDTRRVLQQALERLARAGYCLTCGLEVEFHIYRLTGGAGGPALDP